MNVMVMDPLPVRSENFDLEENIDAKWAVLAKTIVNEPSDKEEAEAKMKEVGDKLKERFLNMNTDEILTEKNIIR